MATKTMNSPLAIIKKDGIDVGLMRDIRITESFTRQRVGGLGRITPLERPITNWDGQLSCGFYTIDFKETGIPDAMRRDAPDLNSWIDNVLLGDDGVDLVIYKKGSDGIDPNTGLTQSQLVEFATIRGAFLDRESMDISEGQVSGTNQEFSYNNPILVQ